MGEQNATIRYRSQPPACFLCGTYNHIWSECSSWLHSKCSIHGHLTEYQSKQVVCSLCLDGDPSKSWRNLQNPEFHSASTLSVRRKQHNRSKTVVWIAAQEQQQRATREERTMREGKKKRKWQRQNRSHNGRIQWEAEVRKVVMEQVEMKEKEEEERQRCCHSHRKEKSKLHTKTRQSQICLLQHVLWAAGIHPNEHVQ